MTDEAEGPLDDEAQDEAQQETGDTPEDDDEAPLHPLQKLLDNPWLLLVLGFTVPFLSYTVWGWVELLLTKPAELP